MADGGEILARLPEAALAVSVTTAVVIVAFVGRMALTLLRRRP